MWGQVSQKEVAIFDPILITETGTLKEYREATKYRVLTLRRDKQREVRCYEMPDTDCTAIDAM